MIATEARASSKHRGAPAHEFRIQRGEFVGEVEPHGDHYWFLVRDLRRERPTIHGFGVDFPRAVNAVSHLLDLLANEH